MQSAHGWGGGLGGGSYLKAPSLNTTRRLKRGPFFLLLVFQLLLYLVVVSGMLAGAAGCSAGCSFNKVAPTASPDATRSASTQHNKKKTKVQPHPLWSHCAGQRVDGNMWCMWELLHKVSLESSTQTRPTFWDQSSAPTLCGGRSRNARLAACGPWWGLFHWMNRSRNDTAAYLAARTRCILRSTNRRCSCSCGSIFCCCCLSFVGVGDTREGAGGAVFADVVLNSSHHHGVSLLSLFFFPGTSVKASHLETTFAAQSEVAVSHWGQISAPSLAPPLTETQQACDL